MARVHHQKRLLTLKIVYYGPGLSGKTTNLLKLHDAYPTDERGDMLRLDTETERTLFFDYFPANLGSIGGFKLKAEFFTVPGQSFYNATRKAVLEGADGIVFVADSAEEREEANLLTLDNMNANLAEMNRTLSDIPHVFQWNKRDTKNPLSTRILNRQLNKFDAPAFEAVAFESVGVWETQTAILERVLADLRGRAQSGRNRA